MSEFNPEAIDGDNDGLVQEGTEFERNVDELEVNPVEEAPVVAPEILEEAPAEPAKLADEVITNAPAKPSKAKAKEAIAPVADGVIGTAAQPAKPQVTKKKATVAADDVALYSTRNVRWEGVGTISRGYNVVSKKDAEKWLTRSHVREATAAEVAKELGL
jgi:hypothetical protein